MTFYKDVVKLSVILYFISPWCFADIVISGNQIVTTPISFTNATLDLSHGQFTIQGSGSLTISNCTVKTTISPTNPYFVLLQSGSLNLTNNIVNVTTQGITPNPNTLSGFNLIRAQQGGVLINGNQFVTTTAYTLGFFSTQGSQVTNGFNISNNTIRTFHGGIYLLNSNQAIINNNIFSNVSFSNILNSGDNLNTLTNNIITFPGNLATGDAVDVINSQNITINNNVISSSSNYGIFIAGGQNININANNITDGLSYGIYIETPSLHKEAKNTHLSQLLMTKTTTFLSNNNITINNNYIAQNRYGLAGGVVNALTVTNNFFLQQFANSTTRQFWTNNANLLPNATNLTWVNNTYKEAFTQDNAGSNKLALQYVVFPTTGGVVIH